MSQIGRLTRRLSRLRLELAASRSPPACRDRRCRAASGRTAVLCSSLPKRIGPSDRRLIAGRAGFTWGTRSHFEAALQRRCASAERRLGALEIAESAEPAPGLAAGRDGLGGRQCVELLAITVAGRASRIGPGGGMKVDLVEAVRQVADQAEQALPRHRTGPLQAEHAVGHQESGGSKSPAQQQRERRGELCPPRAARSSAARGPARAARARRANRIGGRCPPASRPRSDAGGSACARCNDRGRGRWRGRPRTGR